MKPRSLPDCGDRRQSPPPPPHTSGDIEAHDAALVAPEGLEEGEGGGVPQLHRLIVRGRRDEGARRGLRGGGELPWTRGETQLATY